MKVVRNAIGLGLWFFFGLLVTPYLMASDVESDLMLDSGIASLYITGEAAHNMLFVLQNGPVQPFVERAAKKDGVLIHCYGYHEEGGYIYNCSNYGGDRLSGSEATSIYQSLPGLFAQGWVYGEREIYNNASYKCIAKRIRYPSGQLEDRSEECFMELHSDGRLRKPQHMLVGVLN